jgi:hypothetical protein
MKRLTSFVRCRSLANWLQRLQTKAAATGSASIRSAQGDTWLRLETEYAFAGQVIAQEGGIRVLPFFWQAAAQIYGTHAVPTTVSGTSLLESPLIPVGTEQSVVSLVLTGRVEDVTANPSLGSITFTPVIQSVQVQVSAELPASRVAEIRANRGVSDGPGGPEPVLVITSVQPEATLVIPMATIDRGRVTHAHGASSELVHGRGRVELRVPLNIFITDI